VFANKNRPKVMTNPGEEKKSIISTRKKKALLYEIGFICAKKQVRLTVTDKKISAKPWSIAEGERRNYIWNGGTRTQ